VVEAFSKDTWVSLQVRTNKHPQLVKVTFMDTKVGDGENTKAMYGSINDVTTLLSHANV